MNKWNFIQDLKKLRFISDHQEQIKKLALPLVVLLAVVIFWFSGAGGDDGVVVSSGDHSGNSSAADMDASDGADIDDPEAADGNGAGGEASDASGGATGTEQIIYVDLGGAVSVPGVYEVKAGTRLFQVIEKAGGLLDSADIDHINQAEPVTDGQKIIVGSTDINSPYYTGNLQGAGGTGAVGYSGASGSSGNDDTGSYMTGQTGQAAITETENGPVVNINLANESELQLIPGVGPSTAQKILDYRQTYGGFASIEDIKNISGIGEKTFENMKDFIIV